MVSFWSGCRCNWGVFSIFINEVSRMDFAIDNSCRSNPVCHVFRVCTFANVY